MTVTGLSLAVQLRSSQFFSYGHLSNFFGRGHDRMVIGFTTTCAISAYHHLRCEFEPRSWRGVRNTTLSDKVCP